MSAALLAKLTAKGLIIDGTPMGGGLVEISQSDVAGSLGNGDSDRRLSTEAYKYGLAKWCGDTTYVRELQHWLPAWVWGEFNNVHGKKVSVQESVGMATIALLQGLGGYNCPTCLGSCEYRYKVCPGCNGTGKGAMRKTQKAILVNKSPQAYGKTWDQRVRVVEALVQGWEQEGISYLYRQWADFEVAV